MNTLKIIWLTIVHLPRTLIDGFKQRPQQPPGAKAAEAERLDRIRNPSKYRGK
jgi:hypothetical protein